MLISSSNEVKKREVALNIISSVIKEKGRENLYDLTGLAGGLPLKKEDLNLLETYAGPALFEESIQDLGREHLGGERILAFNRTSSGILATILSLVNPGDEVIHYLPKLPSHPSIPRSIELVRANYKEFDRIEEFEVQDSTSLVIITGSTMDHDIISENEFLKIIEISKSEDTPVFVDDASGARLRTVLHNQPKAMDMGADIVITSTDKLMDGPRAGLMAGREEIIGAIKSKAHQFGLEAQPPLVAGIVRALENFNPERIINSLDKKENVYKTLKKEIKNIEKTPTGVMLQSDALVDELRQKKKINISLSSMNVANIFSMLLLKNYHIVTIPAVGMPGVSSTIRIDLSSKDAENINTDHITTAFKETLSDTAEILDNENAYNALLYGPN